MSEQEIEKKEKKKEKKEKKKRGPSSWNLSMRAFAKEKGKKITDIMKDPALMSELKAIHEKKEKEKENEKKKNKRNPSSWNLSMRAFAKEKGKKITEIMKDSALMNELKEKHAKRNDPVGGCGDVSQKPMKTKKEKKAKK